MLATRDILAVDVGTTAFKIGVFSAELKPRAETSRRYDIHLYDRGKADIEPETWWQAFEDACRELGPHLSDVGVVAFSVTTPGLVAMAEDGTALSRAILFCDGRSHAQAREIRSLVTTPLRQSERLSTATCRYLASASDTSCWPWHQVPRQ